MRSVVAATSRADEWQERWYIRARVEAQRQPLSLQRSEGHFQLQRQSHLIQALKKLIGSVCTINVHCIQCATAPTSTGTNRTKGISRIMVSVVQTRKTCCPEITSFWNSKWKGTNNAGLLSVRLALVAYWTSYLQFGARRCVR